MGSDYQSSIAKLGDEIYKKVQKKGREMGTELEGEDKLKFERNESQIEQKKKENSGNLRKNWKSAALVEKLINIE